MYVSAFLSAVDYDLMRWQHGAAKAEFSLGSKGPDLTSCVGLFAVEPLLMKGSVRAERFRNKSLCFSGQRRTVCRLIFRRAILASSLALISYLSPPSHHQPRRPSEMKKPDVVPCNRALNRGQWGFSITPPDRMSTFTLCKKKIIKNLKTSALFICIIISCL